MKQKIKILIAESQNIVAIDLQTTLLKVGHKDVAIVTTGEEAIDKVKELRPDIVILDIYLNGRISGAIAAKRIKEFSKASIMLYSTYKEMSKITNELKINQNKNIKTRCVLMNTTEGGRR